MLGPSRRRELARQGGEVAELCEEIEHLARELAIARGENSAVRDRLAHELASAKRLADAKDRALTRWDAQIRREARDLRNEIYRWRREAALASAEVDALCDDRAALRRRYREAVAAVEVSKPYTVGAAPMSEVE
jgi:predicted RNase H-like nuclease (RuvC/YqgF family)